MVGVAGFEPAAPCSRSRCATRLRYTPAPGGRLISAPPPRRNHCHQAFFDRLPLPLGAVRSGHAERRRGGIGAWPSGKATGFGPVILGSNPSAPTTLILPAEGGEGDRAQRGGGAPHHEPQILTRASGG